MNTRIEVGTPRAAFDVYRTVPEFEPHAAVGADEFARRLADDSALILIAFDNVAAVGFKVGYDRYHDGSWYSWLGGVLPAYRGRGIANALLERQEMWARGAGYERIYVKTRNRFGAMRAMLARAGYEIVALDAPNPATARADLRLTLVKNL